MTGNNPQRYAVIVNETAGGGSARKKWSRVGREVCSRLNVDPVVITYQLPFDLSACVGELVSNQRLTHFISAGGDGTVHLLVNSLLKRFAGKGLHFTVGGVGLGSSNDFIKPARERVASVPLRLNRQNSIVIDAGRVSFEADSGEQKQQFFILNASLGMTADANHYFNTAGGPFPLLKSVWTSLAIIVAATHSIWRMKNRCHTLILDGQSKTTSMTNLAILKTRHVSGSMTYDLPIERGDAQLGFALCEKMNRWEVIKVLIDLHKGAFSGKPKRSSFFAKELSVHTGSLLPLETDGEVRLAKDPVFCVVPRAITLLGL